MTEQDTGGIDPRRLAGVRELAELFRVPRTTVSNWDRRSIGFPSPVTRLGMGPVWDVYAVVRWFRGWSPSRSERIGHEPTEDELRTWIQSRPQEKKGARS